MDEDGLREDREVAVREQQWRDAEEQARRQREQAIAKGREESAILINQGQYEAAISLLDQLIAAYPGVVQIQQDRESARHTLERNRLEADELKREEERARQALAVFSARRAPAPGDPWSQSQSQSGRPPNSETRPVDSTFSGEQVKRNYFEAERDIGETLTSARSWTSAGRAGRESCEPAPNVHTRFSKAGDGQDPDSPLHGSAESKSLLSRLWDMTIRTARNAGTRFDRGTGENIAVPSLNSLPGKLVQILRRRHLPPRE